MSDIMPDDFIAKWKDSWLKERRRRRNTSVTCRLLDEPTPAQAYPDGSFFCFERGATKTTGSEGWAGVSENGSWRTFEEARLVFQGDAWNFPTTRQGA